MSIREEATAVVHRSVDSCKESPSWALRTGCLAQALGWQWCLSNKKDFFLDAVQSGFRGGACLGSVDWKVFSLNGGGPQI